MLTTNSLVALMVAWLCRVLRSDTVTMGGIEQATPAQLTVMMLSFPALSRVLSSRTGRGKNHGLGVVFFMEISALRRYGWALPDGTPREGSEKKRWALSSVA